MSAPLLRRIEIGGSNTKIHAAGDALSSPVRLIGSPGNTMISLSPVIRSMASPQERRLPTPRSYADHLCDKSAETGGQVVISPQAKSNLQTFL